MKFLATRDVQKTTIKKIEIIYEDEEEEEEDGVSYMEDFDGLDYMGYDYQGTEILWEDVDLTEKALNEGFYLPEDEFNDENIGDFEEDEDPATDPDRCIF